MKFLIRNDDVAYDTTLDEIRTFSEICDKYGFKIIQAITPVGEVQKIKSHRMTNNQIKALSSKLFWNNVEVLNYLKMRNDLIGVHGLAHTHVPTGSQVDAAKAILGAFLFDPIYFVPPFNEGDYPDIFEGLITCQLSADKGQRLEDFLDSGIPTVPIMYLHSWRFKGKPYTFGQLDRCLDRLSKV